MGDRRSVGWGLGETPTARVAAALALLAGLLSLAACTRNRPVRSDDEVGTVLARVGSRVITMKDLNDEIARRGPYMRTRYATVEGRQQLLKALVEFELLALHARARGVLNTVEVKTARRRAMVRLLLQRMLPKEAGQRAFLPAEVKRYYLKHRGDFTRPEERRASLIQIPAFPDQRGVVRPEIRKRAMAVLTRARTTARTASSFAALALRISVHPDSQSSKGDLGYLTRTAATKMWGEAWAAMLFSIPSAGQIVGPIQTKKGLHIIRLAEIRRRSILPFREVRHLVESRMRKDRRARRYRQLLARLRKKYATAIDAEGMRRFVAATTAAGRRRGNR